MFNHLIATLQMRKFNEAAGMPVPASVKAGKLLSWRTAAKIYKALSMGLVDKVTEEEAKGYTKYLLLLISAITISGLMEGGVL